MDAIQPIVLNPKNEVIAEEHPQDRFEGFLVVGNDEEWTNIELYNNSTGKWTLVKQLLQRTFFAATRLCDDVIIAGGYHSDLEGVNSVSKILSALICRWKWNQFVLQVLSLNLRSSEMIDLPPMKEIRYLFALSALEGKLYAIGGFGSDAEVLSSVER